MMAVGLGGAHHPQTHQLPRPLVAAGPLAEEGEPVLHGPLVDRVVQQLTPVAAPRLPGSDLGEAADELEVQERAGDVGELDEAMGVGGVDVTEAACPLDQRHLLHHRSAVARVLLLEQPAPRPAEDADEGRVGRRADAVAVGLEVGADLARVAVGRADGLRERPVGEHVEEEREQALLAALVQVVAQLAEPQVLGSREHQELVDVHGQHPVTDRIGLRQLLGPQPARRAPAVAGRGHEVLDVRLVLQELPGPVAGCVVHEQEAVDAEPSVVVQEGGKAVALVAPAGDHDDLVGLQAQVPGGEVAALDRDVVGDPLGQSASTHRSTTSRRIATMSDPSGRSNLLPARNVLVFSVRCSPARQSW